MLKIFSYTLHTIVIVMLFQYLSFAQNDSVSVKDSTTQKSTTTEAVTGVTVPAGTKFSVNINTALSSGKNAAGSTFSAILNADFVFDEKTISPKGSQVMGKIVDSKSGKGVGDAKLSIQFTQMTVNGKLTAIVTDPISVKGGRGRKAEAEIAAGTVEEVPLKEALVIK